MKEATTDNLIRKLSIIEDNPRIVWRSIEDWYGENFFKKIIELDYGVSDMELEKEIEREINHYKK